MDKPLEVDDDDLSTLSNDELMQRLADLTEVLNAVTARQAHLWEYRAAIYVEARSRVPAITHEALATVAGVSKVAVISAVKNRRAALAAEAV